MAEKISKLVITVDLCCDCCYKKIQKILCKLQEQGEKITTISYDVEKNTVTVSGPFDPVKLSKKLWCKGCKVIKNIEIVKEPPKEPEKKKDPPKKPCEVINDIEIVVCEPPKCPPKCPPKPEPCRPKPCPPEPCRPKPCPPEPCPPPVCSDCCRKPCYGECKPCHGECHGDSCCKPYHGQCHGGSRCCSSGKGCGCCAGPPIVPHGGTFGGGHPLMLEEYPSTTCSIM